MNKRIVATGIRFPKGTSREAVKASLREYPALSKLSHETFMKVCVDGKVKLSVKVGKNRMLVSASYSCCTYAVEDFGYSEERFSESWDIP
ncbi:MAG: hypothetical protein WC657_07670 [Candidatus Paceibacterota bacterium]|jgi:hypothetical protein